jgi:hypothetical protein
MGKKENGEGRLAFPVFFAASLRKRPEELEAETDAHFDRPWRIYLSA